MIHEQDSAIRIQYAGRSTPGIRREARAFVPH
jgi:hypothetical protein